MATIAEAFQVALGHHQAGQLPQAEQIYRQILAIDPRHVPTLHLLGVLAIQTGHAEAAIGLLASAVELEPNNPIFRINLGEAYRAAGKFDQAVASYRQAIALDPGNPQPHFFLGLVHEQQGQMPAALESCRRAIAINPDHAEAHYALGNMLRPLGDKHEALACYQRALSIRPDFYDALLNAGSLSRECNLMDQARGYLHRAIQVNPRAAEAHLFLGNLEGACDNWSRAVECYEQAVRLNPKMAAAEARLAMALQTLGQLDAAVTHYRRAVELQPDFAEAHYNLATALGESGRKPEAVPHYEAAIRHHLEHAGAHINLGAYWDEQGDEERALALYGQALAIEPDHAESHFNRSLILLSRGELAAGWAEYEARLRLPKFPVRMPSEPQWDGSPIPEKTLLIHVEQGFGDTFHFMRYVPLAARRCGKVIVQVQRVLLPLLRQSGIENLVGQDEPLPPFDMHAPILSLPGLLGTTLASIPAEIPYLSARPEAVKAWKERLSTLGPFRVGIVWQGSSTHITDHLRSIPLEHFRPLAEIQGLTLVSLQKREGVDQLRAIDFPVYEIEGEWDTTAGAFVDTAAIIAGLDLVITADTAVAHLAGGLGAPVWVALGKRADWRWMRDRQDSPWYPSMRLFRQSSTCDWNELFTRIAAELARYKTARTSGRP